MTRGTVIEVDFISRRRVAARPRGFHAFRQGAQKPVVGFAPFKVIEGGRHLPAPQEQEADADHQNSVARPRGVGVKDREDYQHRPEEKERAARDVAERGHDLDPFALAAVVSRLVRNLAEQQTAGGDLGAGAVGKQGRLFREGDPVLKRDLLGKRTHGSASHHCDCEECEKAGGDAEGD